MRVCVCACVRVCLKNFLTRCQPTLRTSRHGMHGTARQAAATAPSGKIMLASAIPICLSVASSLVWMFEDAGAGRTPRAAAPSFRPLVRCLGDYWGHCGHWGWSERGGVHPWYIEGGEAARLPRSCSSKSADTLARWHAGTHPSPQY